jgi:hypothetical protein
MFSHIMKPPDYSEFVEIDRPRIFARVLLSSTVLSVCVFLLSIVSLILGFHFVLALQ